VVFWAEFEQKGIRLEDGDGRLERVTEKKKI